MVKSYQADLLIDYYYLDVTYKDSKLIHSYFSFENKMFVDITQQCFALLPQVNFPANNLNFH